jgi:hypothetical protein
LTQEKNLSGLAAINREMIARAETIESPQRLVLDIDSTEIQVYGQQENNSYNGHSEPNPRQRQPGAGHRGVADAARRKTEPQTRGLVQGVPPPSRELEDGAACGGEGGVPLWRTVSSRRVHRDQLGYAELGGSTTNEARRSRGSKKASKP